VQPDTGDVAIRKRTRLELRHADFGIRRGSDVRSVIEAALKRAGARRRSAPRGPPRRSAAPALRRFDTPRPALSGGWRKRLAIAKRSCRQPDILLLDEPTNHLDLAGIKWLETLLQNAPFACVVVSHDRYFLENVATEVVELERAL
jgi:ABC transport system ATP-binding/permease protein